MEAEIQDQEINEEEIEVSDEVNAVSELSNIQAQENEFASHFSGGEVAGEEEDDEK